MRIARSSGLDWFNWTLIGSGALILLFLLFLPPALGIGDNEDWHRIMSPTGFRHLPDAPKGPGYFVSKVAFAEVSWWQLRHGPVSSGVLVALVARVVGPWVTRDGLFDLRILGVMHALILLLGMGLILCGTQSLSKTPRRIPGVLLIVFFTDLGYVAFLNSFYSQTASLLFLLMTAGTFLMLLRGSRSGIWFSAFVLSSLLFSTSKPQEATQSILLAIPIIMSAKLTTLARPVLTASAIALVVVLISLACATRARGVHDNSLFNHFFLDLLQHSPDPEADLKTLDLDPALAVYKGRTAFEPDSPMRDPRFRGEFFAKVDYPDILVFYAAHPKRLWSLLSRRARLAFTIDTVYGNYDRSAGYPEWTQSRWWRLWGRVKMTIFPGSLWTLISILSLHVLAIFTFWKRKPRTDRLALALAGFAVLNLMAMSAFLICATFDAESDAVRQLYAFNAMTDLLILVDVSAIAYAVRSLWQ